MAAYKNAVLCLIAAIWFQVNEAVRTASRTSSSSQLSSPVRWARQKLPVDEMTVDNALHVLDKSNRVFPELVSLVQRGERHHVSHEVKSHKHHQASLRKGDLHHHGTGAKNTSDSDYGSKVTGALLALNEMLHETKESMDMNELECIRTKKVLSQLISEAKVDQELRTVDREEASGWWFKASSWEQTTSEELKRKGTAFEEDENTCKRDVWKFKREMNQVAGDQAVIEQVLNMSKCEKTNASTLIQLGESSGEPNIQLLRCKKPTGKQSYIKLGVQGHDKLWEELSKVEHVGSKRALEEALLRTDAGALVQKGAEEPEECSIAGSALCEELQTKFLNILGEIEDTYEQLQTMLANTEHRCEVTRQLWTRESNHLNQAVNRYAGIKDEYGAQETRLSTQIEVSHKYELDKTRQLDEKNQECTEIEDNSKEEKCALEKIRGELSKMYQLAETEVYDCEVEEWEEDDCSVSCGWGQQALHREILQSPTVGGTKCPLLRVVQPCYNHRCDVPCRVSPTWSGWSECTSFCGQGIKHRARAIEDRGNTGRCDDTSDTEECWVEGAGCDKDCKVDDTWTLWRSCTAPKCGGGRMTRMRRVLEPAIGNGMCPDFHSGERWDVRSCNDEPCRFDPTKVFKCDSKLDLVIVMDGSGSLMWYPGAWEAVKNVSETLVSYMGSSAQASVIIFHGPPWPTFTCTSKPWWWSGSVSSWCFVLQYWVWWNDINQCMHLQVPQQSYAQYYTEHKHADCGVDFVSHMSENRTLLESRIEATAFPMGTATMTGLAILSARAELQRHQRQGAVKRIVVITDGIPTSQRRAIDAANLVKSEYPKDFALAMIGVGAGVGQSPQALELFQEAASGEEYVKMFPEVSDLTAKENIESVASKLCPKYHEERLPSALSSFRS